MRRTPIRFRPRTIRTMPPIWRTAAVVEQWPARYVSVSPSRVNTQSEAQDEGDGVGQHSPARGLQCHRRPGDWAYGRGGGRNGGRGGADDPDLAEVGGHDRQDARRDERHEARDQRRGESQIQCWYSAQLGESAEGAVEKATDGPPAHGERQLRSTDDQTGTRSL